MNTSSRIALSLVTVAALVGSLAATANAQYYTPLRYDLRYTSPTYIPSGTLQFGPSDRSDSYAFGAPRYQDFGMTGNLRGGKSFQGHVPYSAIGNQLATTLPSLSLSKFRRDSVSIADVASGVEYGIPEIYIPSSGAVTDLATAMNRFAPPRLADRAPYALPNVNAAYVGPPPTLPSGGYVGSGVPEGTLIVPGVSPQQLGMTIPQGSLAWVDALIAGRVTAPVTPLPTPTDAEIEKARKQETRLGLPAEIPDLRLGLRPPTVPEAAAKPQAETEFETRTLEENEAELLRLMPGGQAPRRTAAEREAPKVAPPARKNPTPAEEEAVPGPGEPELRLPPAPGAYQPAATAPVYVGRARAAMKAANYDQAEAYYAAALTLDPNQPDAFFGRVYAMLGTRNYLQAAVVLQGQLFKHATWLKTMPELRPAYPKPDVYPRIVADLKEHVAADPDSLNYNFLLGYVYFAGGDNASARPCLERAAKLRGEKPGPEKFVLTAMDGRKEP